MPKTHVPDQQAGETARALRLVVLLGVVSLFADATYEGGRSLLGPFLLLLGAGPLTVGLVAGAGEFLGYAVRYPAGLCARSPAMRRFLLYAGYLTNLVALPLLAWTHRLVLAVVLLFLERLGRGVRNPAKKALLAGAGDRLGAGRAFGLHEALDSLGAVGGPLLVAAVLARGMRAAFAWLSLPASLAFLVLVVTLAGFREQRAARTQSPGPGVTEAGSDRGGGFPWLCVYGGSLALGLAPMVLLGYDAVARGDWSVRAVVLAFAWAMATSALSALVAGRLYDRFGNGVLKAIAPLVPLAMLGLAFAHPGVPWLVLAFTVWGLAVGALEGTLPAAVSRYAGGAAERARLFGVFDTVYGLAWLAGGALLGWLVGHRPREVFVYALACSVVSIYALHRQGKKRGRAP